MDEVTVGRSALERTPLFAGLDRGHLEDVVAVGQRVSYDPGQAIVERGDFFGEMVVLAGKPREATVKAVEPMVVLRIPAEEFQAFLAGNPQIAVGMLKSLVERLREVQDRLDTWIGGVW